MSWATVRSCSLGMAFHQLDNLARSIAEVLQDAVALGVFRVEKLREVAHGRVQDVRLLVVQAHAVDGDVDLEAGLEWHQFIEIGPMRRVSFWPGLSGSPGSMVSTGITTVVLSNSSWACTVAAASVSTRLALACSRLRPSA